MVTVGLVVLYEIADRFFGFSLPSGVSTVLPPMLAAMNEGVKVARETNQPMESRVAWRAALWMTAVAVAINIAFMVIILLFVPSMASLFSTLGLTIFAGIMVFALVIVLLVNRFFLTMGLKNELKRINK